MDCKILERDPHLKYFSYDIELRMQRYWSKKERFRNQKQYGNSKDGLFHIFFIDFQKCHILIS